MKIVLAALVGTITHTLAVAAAPLSPVESAAGELQDFTHGRLAAAVAPIAERALQEQGIVGFSLAIAHKGQPVYVAGFGMANLERQLPATGDTQYEIASISKMFTAIAVLQLVEKGLIDLGSPVSRYLPNYDGPLRNVPVQALLNHTSGFRDGPLTDDLEQLQRETPRTTDEMVAMTEHSQGVLVRPPGEDFLYSNAAFDLTAIIIEEVTGKAYGEVIREQIFDPAQMSHSTAGQLFGGALATTNYSLVEDKPVPIPNIHLSFFNGSGSIASTPRDLLAFQFALNGGRLLKAASLEIMREPALVTIAGKRVKVPYGLGTRHGPTGGRRKLGHTGTGSGSAVLVHYPDDEVTIVVLANTSNAVHARQLESRIAHAVFLDESPVYSSKPIPFDEHFARALTGRYRIGESHYDHKWEEGELRVYRAEASEMRGRLLRVGSLATVYVAGSGELPTTLPEGAMSNPPYEIDEWDPNGDWAFTYGSGGLFLNLARRVEPSD